MDHFAGLNVSVKEKSILTVRGSSSASRKQNPRQVTTMATSANGWLSFKEC